MIWPLQLLSLALLVLCSFIVSGSETALFALSSRDRKVFAASPSRFKRLASELMSRPRRVLMTVLIVNTAINVAIFAVSYVTFGAVAHATPLLAACGGAIGLVIVILFGEIIPKAVALANARKVAPVVAPLIHVLQIATGPFSGLLRVAFVEPLTRILSPGYSGEAEATGDDLRALVETTAEQGIISTREHDMLQAVVALPEITVRSVMVPRVGIRSIPVNAQRDAVRRAFQETGFKKLPVHGRDLDDIRGLLYARDLYLRAGEPLKELVRPVPYVPEVINLLQLIRHFRRTHAPLAIVVDEYGGVSGLVTPEDVLEEIVGELEQAGRPIPEPTVERIDDQTYRLSGSLSIRPWRRLLGMTETFTQVDTIGGVVLASLGRPPRIGDTVRFGNLAVIVDRLEGRRIDRVLIKAEAPGRHAAGGGDQP